MEIWKTIKGFEDYQVSNFGNVKSLSKKTLMKGKYVYFSKEKKLCPSTQKNGYLSVGLSLNNKTKTFLVHRLVCEAFLKNTDNKRTANHIDGNKKNNNLINLEWATHKENLNHAVKIGLIKIGEENKTSKVKNLDVLEIRKSNLKAKELALIHKISISTVYSIKRKETWGHV